MISHRTEERLETALVILYRVILVGVFVYSAYQFGDAWKEKNIHDQVGFLFAMILILSIWRDK